MRLQTVKLLRTIPRKVPFLGIHIVLRCSVLVTMEALGFDDKLRKESFSVIIIMFFSGHSWRCKQFSLEFKSFRLFCLEAVRAAISKQLKFTYRPHFIHPLLEIC